MKLLPSYVPSFPAGVCYVVLLCSLTACDSTPRQRQEIVRQQARKLDTLTAKAGAKLRTAGRRTLQYDSANRARKSQPLNPAATTSFANELLGTYANLRTITPDNVAAAYTQLLRQVRARRRAWTQRDWDYADHIYQRLNARLKAIHLDVRASDDVRVRALQAEYLTLSKGRDVKDLSKAIRK